MSRFFDVMLCALGVGAPGAFFILFTSRFPRDILFSLSNFFQRKGGDMMAPFFNLLVSVAAGVICYYVCKWLDRNGTDR
jgi:hypothetical protein